MNIVYHVHICNKIKNEIHACKLGPLKYVIYSGPWYTGLGRTIVCTTKQKSK